MSLFVDRYRAFSCRDKEDTEPALSKTGYYCVFRRPEPFTAATHVNRLTQLLATGSRNELVKQHCNKRPCINPPAPVICCGCVSADSTLRAQAALLGQRAAAGSGGGRSREPVTELRPFSGRAPWSRTAGAKEPSRWRGGNGRPAGGTWVSPHTEERPPQTAVGGGDRLNGDVGGRV